MVCGMILSACSRNEIVNQSIEEYKIQNENLQSKVKELEETIQNYKETEDDKTLIETDIKYNFRIVNKFPPPINR